MNKHNGDCIIERLSGFADHDQVYFIHDAKHRLKGYLALHRLYKGKISVGGTRLQVYADEQQALQSALRLSKLMTDKLRVSGLEYGGAKAVLLANELDQVSRRQWLDAYANCLRHFSDRFLTGVDAGLADEDVRYLSKTTDNLAGLRYDVSALTAQSVFIGIQISLHEVYKSYSIKSRRFAIKGLGKVGYRLLNLLYADAGQVFVADIDQQKIEAVKRAFPKVTVVSEDQIDKQAVDVFSPCALGGAITAESVDYLKCKIIAGSANNQLADEAIAKKLHQNSILYAPDVLINSGGLLAVVDEYEHQVVDESRLLARIDLIGQKLEKTFSISRSHDVDTLSALYTGQAAAS